ncbi:aminotransferase class III-fold pyridoxal phosphate-dependent enzyme, partial [uncultured Treponema sp.]|uniref:aminotransferase class III-fold pyridoxal phosphate-dependent enzyme n=1 Tax=uncultured Treponema sp. TaxID=162155 RepID=UPI002592B623
MTGKEISEMQTKYVLQSWSKQGGLNPTSVERCEGIYIYDKDGKRYADMSSEQVNVNAGYGNKEMNEAIKAQLDEYAYIQGSFGAEPRALLAKSIVDRLPDCFGKIFFTNGGADANENAIKIARMYTGRFKVMSQYRSYHGSTFGAGNLTGEPRHFALEPAIPGFIHFRGPYSYQEKIKFASEEEEGDYYVEKLREQVIFEGGDRIAAIILETVVGSNGIIIYPKNYLKGVRKICDEFGIMMICDEVMAGWYRTGKMFAYMNFDVVPDIITFAKGVNSGYIPLGGAIVKNEIAHFFDDKYLSCGLTYSGHPLACAAGVACQEFYLKNDIEGHVQKVGKHLGEVLE